MSVARFHTHFRKCFEDVLGIKEQVQLIETCASLRLADAARRRCHGLSRFLFMAA